MLRPRRSAVEDRRIAMQKRVKRSLKEKDKALQKRAAHTAQLRAVRLAREAADKDAAMNEDSEATPGKRKKPLCMPKVHRPQT